MTFPKRISKPEFYSDDRYGLLFASYLRALRRAGRELPKLRKRARLTAHAPCAQGVPASPRERGRRVSPARVLPYRGVPSISRTGNMPRSPVVRGDITGDIRVRSCIVAGGA